MAQDIPPELMKLMQGGGQGANLPPKTSPMSTPQPNEGEKQGAMVQVQMAMSLLEQTLSSFGSDSEEGQAVLTSLKTLGSKFASKREKGRDLIPSEIMNLVASMPKSARPGAPQPGAQPGMGMPPGQQQPQPMMQ
jgi:hypothetical protein